MSQRASDVYLQNNVKPPTEKQRLEEEQRIKIAEMQQWTKEAQALKQGDTLTAEDKFYEKLGIKYHNTHMFGRPSRTKGRLLVALALVAGYFAYKKFKK
jgi:hypothetical protein